MRNQVSKDELKVRVLKLKNAVDGEPSTVWQGEKDLAHKYLNEVLFMLDEYRTVSYTHLTLPTKA